ncbi:MAG: AAA family ATPase [Acidimicrobiales bacterium]
MRISSFHVDGFGALADFGQDDLAPGLVVILGPNEAGKSTLFDFLTGVLFGFPLRRDNVRFRSPVRGGRHGGRIGFVDEAGGCWIVERHAGAQRGLVVTLPDGSLGDEQSLSAVLAGANASLFEAVFAVRLDDLGQLKNLESDAVREMLFAASIFGQRRSAAAALRHLAEARDELARPRRNDAAANRLQAQLEQVRAELAAARAETEGFADLKRRSRGVEDELRRLRKELREAVSRERDLDLLDVSRHHYEQATAARRDLEALPLPGPRATLLEHAEPLRELRSELSGHLERVEQLELLVRRKSALEGSVNYRLAQIGPAWTRQGAMDAPAPELLAATVREKRDQLAELSTHVAAREAVLAQVESLLSGMPAQDGIDVPLDRHALERRRTMLLELRGHSAEAERLELEVLGYEQRLPDPESTLSGMRQGGGPALVALLSGGLLVLVLGGMLVLRGQWEFGLPAALLGLVLTVAGAVLWSSARRHPSRPPACLSTRIDSLDPVDPAQGPPADRPGPEEADRPMSVHLIASRRALLKRARSEIDELARALEMGTPPSRVEIESYAATLQQHFEQRNRLDDRTESRHKAIVQRDAAAGELYVARRSLAEAQSAYRSWCGTHGFAEDLDTEATLEAIARLAELRERLRDLSAIDGAISERSAAVAFFAQRYKDLYDLIDSALIGRSVVEEVSVSVHTIKGQIAELIDQLDSTADVEARRATSEAELEAAESALTNVIGRGEAADRLRTRLTSGDVVTWAGERAELREAIEELRRCEEEAVRQHQSLAEVIDRLSNSDRIAELERRHDAIEMELDAALRRYLVFGAGQALLQRTLSQHERERQPAVVARAGEHFKRVTAGRYTGLLANAGADGNQGFRVVASSGEVVDAASLSRGSIEQLYLCLRLGLADSFAARSVALPILLDDVLVNFDPDRARAVAVELVNSSASHQILLLTCHPEVAEMVTQACALRSASAQVIRLARVA